MDTAWQTIVEVWGRLMSATLGLRQAARQGIVDLGDRLAGVDLGLSRDTALVTSTMLGLLSLVALASAFADRRIPWIGLLLLGGALGLGWWTFEIYPGSLTVDAIARAYIQIIANVIR